MKKHHLIRRVSVLLSLALMISLAVPMPVMAAGGGKLVKSVSEYDYAEQWKDGNVISAKYKLIGKTKFKYDKGLPKDVQSLNYEDGDGTASTFKYKLKKKKAKSAKVYNALAGKKLDTKRKYTKKGWCKSASYSNLLKTVKSTSKYSYNKKGFVTAYQNSYTSSNFFRTNTYRSFDKVTYKYTMKKGLPRDLVVTATSSSSRTNTLYPEENYSHTSTPSQYFVTFNKKGLITSAGNIIDGKRYVDYTVQYKMKKGKVKTATINWVEENNEDGSIKKLTPTRKYNFSYAKDKASKGKYANMINDLLDFGAYYGVYNWY